MSHWAVTSGSLLLVHKPHYRGIAIEKGSTLSVKAVKAANIQEQGSVSLRTIKTTVYLVTPELDMELEVCKTTQTRVETMPSILLIMAINISKPWGISWFSDLLLT